MLSASGYGAVEESGGRNRTLSSSVRLTRTTAKKQRPHKETKQAGEASWLKEVRKGERGAEDKEMNKN